MLVIVLHDRGSMSIEWLGVLSATNPGKRTSSRSSPAKCCWLRRSAGVEMIVAALLAAWSRSAASRDFERCFSRNEMERTTGTLDSSEDVDVVVVALVDEDEEEEQEAAASCCCCSTNTLGDWADDRWAGLMLAKEAEAAADEDDGDTNRQVVAGSGGPKIVSACSMSSSITLVWCTVSTSDESEADPSDVLSRVGPKTIPKLEAGILFDSYSAETLFKWCIKKASVA